jgi:hypothetical protein
MRTVESVEMAGLASAVIVRSAVGLVVLVCEVLLRSAL